MGTVANSLSQAANAQLGAPLPLAYGYVRARGNNILLNPLATKNRVAFYILGEGPWDGIERLWINKKLVDITDTKLVHFHPGTDGTLGGGLTPTSTGGDQLVDQFFSSIPANYQPLTYSRMAYLAVNVPPDPAAPDANLDVIGDYRGMKIRIFDGSGNQTAFQFSTNGAWQVLDLILRTMLNPEWTVAAASAGGGDLTTWQKARINWSAVASAASWCDATIPNGQKRFESSLAIVNTMKLQQALQQLLAMSQIYITEEAGQIFILPDQPRGSTFTLTSDHVVSGTADFDKADLHGAPNRLVATWNELNPTDTADIDTPGNSGLVRASNVVTCKTIAAHPYLPGDNVQVVNPTDSSFAGVQTVATVPSSTTFTYNQAGSNATSGNGYTGTAESRFAQRGTQADHEKHQQAIGSRGLRLDNKFRRLPLNIDLGNNTMERAMRILNFLKLRNLGAETTPYNAPFTGKVTCYLDAVDANLNSLAEQLVGDIITVDSSISEEFQGLYEIRKKTWNLPAFDGSSSSGSAKDSASAATVDLELLQYLSSAFSDVATIVNGPASAPTHGNQPPALISDNLVRNGDFDLGLLNWGRGWPDAAGAGPTLSSAVTIQTNVSGLPRGSSKMLINCGASTVCPGSQELVPVDKNKTYFIDGWIRIPTPLTGGITASLAFAEYDNNRNAIAHTVSGAGLGYLALSLTSTTSNGWQYFWMEVTGDGGTSPAAGQFNTNTKFITYVVLVTGGSGTNQTVEVDGVRWSEVAAGSRRATSGLQQSGQLQSSFKNNTLNANGHFTGGNPLTQSGATSTILVAASTVQFGAGQVSYNSGSVNPGSLGTWYVYADDPTFAGGAVTYQATQTASLLTAADGRVFFGSITTNGGGGTSGTGGGGSHNYP